MVTYKWPSWLHKQTEKMRIIWAYKILFLDVLFPLNVSRIIFCDSDQVVRADLVCFCWSASSCAVALCTCMCRPCILIDSLAVISSCRVQTNARLQTTLFVKLLCRASRCKKLQCLECDCTSTHNAACGMPGLGHPLDPSQWQIKRCNSLWGMSIVCAAAGRALSHGS
jgi:hypothetical protein